jgi:hypothetical protein
LSFAASARVALFTDARRFLCLGFFFAKTALPAPMGARLLAILGQDKPTR